MFLHPNSLIYKCFSFCFLLKLFFYLFLLKPWRIWNLFPVCIAVNTFSSTTFRAHQELIFITGQILRGTEYLQFMLEVVTTEV